MPAKATGSSPGTRGRRASGVAKSSPWAPLVEAAQSAKNRFADPVAMEGVEAMDASGPAIREVGQALKVVGQRLADEIDWDPRILPFFEGLGDMVIKAADPAERGAAAIRRAEADRIENVEEGGAKRERWDIRSHRERGR